MGENDTATQEGPGGQGVGRVVAADEDVPDSTGLARGVRTPHDAVEEPTEGGAAVVDAAAVDDSSSEDTRTPTTRPQQVLEESQAGAQAYAPFATQQKISSTPSKELRTESPSKLINRYGPATLAGNGTESMVEARINSISNAGISDSDRDPVYLARKLMKGNLVRFESREERAAVEEEAKKLAKEMMQRQHDFRKRIDNLRPPRHKFAPLNSSVQQRIVNDMVAGRVQDSELLSPEKEISAAPLMEKISRMALMNDTYTRGDRARLVDKVRSLLPATMAARSPQPKTGPPSTPAAGV
jgi:hypothetical protein